MESNVQEGVEYAQHQTFSERREVAQSCAIGLKLTLPTLVDSMDNSADRVYQGWPERLYVLSTEGRVAYQGGKGPYGFLLEELDAFLQEYIGDSGGET